MTPTIGQRLDDSTDFFHWMNHAVLSIAVLKMVVETDLCGQLGESPKTIHELAAHCRVSADHLRRVIEFLACEEVLALTADGRVLATERTRKLHERGSMIMVQSRSSEAGPSLLDGLRRNVSAYEARFGAPVFDHLRDQPDMAGYFSHFMGFLTARVEAFVFSKHAFHPFSRAVDVGGSHGGLLKGLLARHPSARGVLFDLPGTAALVADALRASPEGDRIEVVGGDFFEAVPAGDLYLIKMVLHDWNDAECVSILKSVRAAIAPGGRVVVIEHLRPERPRRTPARFMDMAMMVWATGRERRLSEFETLFTQAGFRLDRVTENPDGQSVIEAVPF
jgi:hypothetical protein